MRFSFAIALLPVSDSLHIAQTSLKTSKPTEWCLHGNLIKYGPMLQWNAEVIKDWYRDETTCRVWTWNTIHRRSEIFYIDVTRQPRVQISKKVCDRLATEGVVSFKPSEWTPGTDYFVPSSCRFQSGDKFYSVNLLFKEEGSDSGDTGILDVYATQTAMTLAQTCAYNENCWMLSRQMVFESCTGIACEIRYKGQHFYFTPELAKSDSLSEVMNAKVKLALCDGVIPLRFRLGLGNVGYMISNQHKLDECSFTLYRMLSGESRTVTYEKLLFTENALVDFSKTWDKGLPSSPLNFEWCKKGKKIDFFWHGKRVVDKVKSDPDTGARSLNRKCELEKGSISILLPVTVVRWPLIGII